MAIFPQSGNANAKTNSPSFATDPPPAPMVMRSIIGTSTGCPET